jgi:outer membrane protein TolC
VEYRFAVAVHQRALIEARTHWLERSLALRLATGEPLRPGDGLISTTLPADPFTAALPTEAEAAQAAVNHSRDLLVALEELNIKKITVQSIGREHWPNLDVSAGVGPMGRSNTAGGAHKTLFGFKSIGWSVGLTMSYLVGHRVAKAAQEQANLEVQRQELALDEIRQTLVASATQAVALLRLDKRLVATSEKEHALAVLRLENERKRFAVGRSSLFVLLQLQQDVTSAAHKALTARLGYLKRWADLETLTGALLHRFGLGGDKFLF